IQATWFPHAQTDITERCLTYLLFDTFKDLPGFKEIETSNFFEKNPLVNYATNYCLVHAKGQPEFLLKNMIVTFL
ncbi:hypothetical protein B0H10DRAFT_1712656, partial [Mycena sp. CBHHK59/15]